MTTFGWSFHFYETVSLHLIMKHLYALLLMFCGIFAATGQLPVITVKSNDAPALGVPVRVSVSMNPDPAKQYEIRNSKTGKKAALQFIDAGRACIFILPDALGAHDVATYTVHRIAAGRYRNVVTIDSSATGDITVMVHKKKLFTYHAQVVAPPADSASYYQRSGFIHPLYSPNGAILTDDFPAGHAHQHALFAAWTNTTFRKSFVDFWNQQQKKGTVEHIKVLTMQSGTVCGLLEVLLRYKSWEHGEVLQEKWKLYVYPFQNSFLFDLESEQFNSSSDTLFVNKYHYGGMGFRGSRYWNPDDKKNYRDKWSILTSEGIRDSAANHTHAKWVDASGRIGNDTAGVTVFGHASNFRYPQPIRVHPQMPYWVFAPMVEAGFSIAPGAYYRSKFRYWVHQGLPNLMEIKKWERDFNEPVNITVRSN